MLFRTLILLMAINLAAHAQIEIEIDTGDKKDNNKNIDIPGPTNGNGFEGPGQLAQKKAMDDVIRLKSGDKLHGNLIAYQTKMGVTWTRPGIKGPIVFDEKSMRGIKLFKQTSIKPQGAYVYLTNDDVLYGQIISLDKENLKLKTWYAGALTIPKVMVRSILPGSSEGPIIMDGPGKLKEWQQYGNWKLEGKDLIASTSSSTIGKIIPFGDKVSISVDLKWTSSYPQISIIPFTQSIQNYYSHGYNIKVSRSSLQLYQGSNRRLSSSISYDFSKTKNVKMNILIDKSKKNVIVYINNKKVGDWQKVQYTPSGKSLVLFASGGKTTFGNLKIRKWDGKIPDSIGSDKSKGDLVVFKNGDKMSGNVISINKGVVKLKTEFAEMPVPIKNVTQMTFDNEDLIRARRNKNDVKAFFAGGNSLTFEISRIEKNQIFASSENFSGDIKLDMNAFVGIMFNIYDGNESAMSDFETFVYSD